MACKADPRLKFLADNFDRLVAQGRAEHGERWEAAVDGSGHGAEYRAAADRGDAEIARKALVAVYSLQKHTTTIHAATCRNAQRRQGFVVQKLTATDTDRAMDEVQADNEVERSIVLCKCAVEGL